MIRTFAKKSVSSLLKTPTRNYSNFLNYAETFFTFPFEVIKPNLTASTSHMVAHSPAVATPAVSQLGITGSIRAISSILQPYYTPLSIIGTIIGTSATSGFKLYKGIQKKIDDARYESKTDVKDVRYHIDILDGKLMILDGKVENKLNNLDEKIERRFDRLTDAIESLKENKKEQVHYHTYTR